MQNAVMLQPSQPLRVWEKIEIQIGDELDAGRYLARIQDFLDDGIAITEPEFITGSSLLRDDADVTVLVTRDDAAYAFRSRIHASHERAGRRFILSRPARVERVQRRRFVRLELVGKVAYAVIPRSIEWHERDKHLTWIQSHTFDLSAGGLSMRLDNSLELGTPLVLAIDFFKQRGLPAMIAAVVRRVARRDNELIAGVEFLTDSQLHAHFDDVSELPEEFHRFDTKIQNDLVTLVFRAQIDLRKKGLL